MEEKVCLKIPYVSEFVSYEILRYIRKRKLPINVIFTPGNKLRDIHIIIQKCARVCLSVCLCRFYLKTVNGNDLIPFATWRHGFSSGFKILTKFLTLS